MLAIAIEIRFANLQGYPVSSNEEVLTSTKGMLTLKQVLVQVPFLLYLVPCEISSSHGFRKARETRWERTKKKGRELIQRRGL
jgi:hypothetical protein